LGVKRPGDGISLSIDAAQKFDFPLRLGKLLVTLLEPPHTRFVPLERLGQRQFAPLKIGDDLFQLRERLLKRRLLAIDDRFLFLGHAQLSILNDPLSSTMNHTIRDAGLQFMTGADVADAPHQSTGLSVLRQAVAAAEDGQRAE